MLVFLLRRLAFGVLVVLATAVLALQAVAVWASVCIVVVGILADLALAARDPRVRAAGRVG